MLIISAVGGHGKETHSSRQAGRPATQRDSRGIFLKTAWHMKRWNLSA